ncbi:MAG: protein kinase [Chitinivibrionales bacterium]|nr:protein kinase [Chitinivibrionales bacterium]
MTHPDSRSTPESARALERELERTVPAEDFTPHALQRALEETQTETTESITPQSYLRKTQTDQTDGTSEDTAEFSGFSDSARIAPKLLDSAERQGPRFETLGVVGKGGTARVYAVRDRSLNRTIALKLLRTRGAAKPHIENRFIHEARVTAMLEHPNIMPVHDIGTTDKGQVYFTMKNIAGSTLGDAIRADRNGRPVPEEFRTTNGKLNLFLKVCDALSFAHDRGWVHQDVKPDNIMLGEYGEVLLLDWGCALDAGEAVAGGRHSAFGTPAYMSPEQARREPVDERSDVYCLGATMFHVFTGRHPTWSQDPETFWNKKRAGRIDPLTDAERRAVPAALLAICMTALQADPSQRYQTVSQIARDLQRYQSGQAVSVHRESLLEMFLRWYRRNRRVFWISASATVLVGASAGLLLREKIKEWVTWRQLYVQDFSNYTSEQFGRDWHYYASSDWFNFSAHEQIDNAAWGVRDGALYGLGKNALNALTFARPIPGDLRIEWDITLLRRANNANCYIGGVSRNEAYTFHVGHSNSSVNANLTKGAQLQLLDRTVLPDTLRIGETHRMRMEREGQRVRLLMNGRTVFDYRDPDVLSGLGHQTFGFEVALGNEIVIDNIVVYHHPLPLKVSPLAVPERLAAEGDVAAAVRHYRELANTYPGTDVAHMALLGVARSLAGLDSVGAATEAYRTYLASGPSGAHALLARSELASLLKRQGMKTAADSLIDEVVRHAGQRRDIVRSVLLHQSDTRTAELERRRPHLGSSPRYDSTVFVWIDHERAMLQHWYRTAGLDPSGDGFLVLAVSTVAGPFFGLPFDSVLARFPAQSHAVADQMTRVDGAAVLLKSVPMERELCAKGLDEAGAFQKIIDEFPDQPEWVAEALLECGRYDLLLERHPQARHRCALALAAQGDYERLLREYPDAPEACALALLRTGQYERLLRDYPAVSSYALPAAVQLGRPYEYFRSTKGYASDNIDGVSEVLHKSDSMAMMIKAMRPARVQRIPYTAERVLAESGRLHELPALLNAPDVVANTLMALYRPEEVERRYPGNLMLRALRMNREGKVDSMMAFDTQRPQLRTQALHKAGRYQTLRERYPLHRIAAAQTLLAMRRYQEVLDSFPDQYELVPRALYGLGLLDSVLHTPSVDGRMQVLALLDKGDLATVRQTYPDFRNLQARYLYRNDRFDELLQQYPDQTLYAGLALVASGHESRLPFDSAAFILGRLERHQVLTHWAVRERRAGNRAKADSLLAIRPIIYNRPGDFVLRFSECLLPAVLAAFDGNRDTLSRVLSWIAAHRRYAFGQRLYYEAGYLAGALSRVHFLAQPYGVGARETILLLDGIREELAGNPVRARHHYEEALRIPPPLSDLVSSYWLYEDEGLRSFIAWRLAECTL